MRNPAELTTTTHEETPARKSPAPGKRTRSERRGGGPAPQPTPAPAAGDRAPASAAPHDDPFGLHLLGNADAMERASKALGEVAEAVEDVGKKLKDGAKLTGSVKSLAGVSRAMKQASEALQAVADVLDLATQVTAFIAATERWSDAFDAFQARPSRDNGVELVAATDHWCELAIDAAGHLPRPHADVIVNGLKGARVAIEVGVRVRTESLTITRAEEAAYPDGAPPPAPSEPEAPERCHTPAAYRRAFDATVETRRASFGPGAVPAGTVDEFHAQIDRWDAVATELAGLTAFWKIGPLADQPRIADARERQAAIVAWLDLMASSNAAYELPRPELP